MPTFRSICFLCAVVLAGCTAAANSSPTPAPSPAEFTMEVSPPEEPAAVRMAIPGSRYCFLVVITDEGDASPVTITAAAEKASVLDIRPAELAPGTVGEVCVAADPATAETIGSVTITATRGELTRSVTRSLPIFPMTDERPDAQPHFERWVAWLAEAHPELGITEATTFEPVFVSTLLVVSHYSYWSEDWELTIAWHNMIAPDDWSEIHLRRRGVDVAPSMAFRQDSVSGATTPHAVAPPDVVVR